MGVNESLADLHDTTSFFSGQYDAPAVIITICCALAIYNALELLLLIFTTFRRFNGLYFWSLLVASAGVIPYVIGFMIEYFNLTAQIAGVIISTFGWPMMVTGQSLVLYSRLHVVLGKGNQRLLKGVKWMIVIDGLVFHIATSGTQSPFLDCYTANWVTVVVFGAYLRPRHTHFSEAYKYIEKVQMTGFTIQEFILSGIYVWKTVDILQSTDRNRKFMYRTMWQLFSINVLIIIMDIALLVVEYQDRHVIEQALKEVIYSVKLKLEFAILSKLVGITKGGQPEFMTGFAEIDDPPDGEREKSVMTLDSSTNSRRPLQKPHDNDAEKGGDWQVDKVSIEPTERSNSVSFGSATAITTDERRKRRTIEEDEYAIALRDCG